MEFLKLIGYVIAGVAIVLGLYDHLTNKYILVFLRKIRFRLFNEPIKIKTTYVEKFKTPPINRLDFDIFKEIKNSIASDEISKRGINEKCIKIYSKNLGIDIGIWLDEEISSFNSDTPKISNYKIVVGMQNEIRLAYKDFEDLNDFLILTRKSSEIIQRRCFPSPSKSFQKFIICDIKRDFKILIKKREKLRNVKLNMNVSIYDDKITLSLRDPEKLIVGIKKYYAI